MKVLWIFSCLIVISYVPSGVRCAPAVNTMNLNANSLNSIDNDGSIEIPVRQAATPPPDNSLKKMYNQFFNYPKQTLLSLLHNVLEILKRDTEKEIQDAKEKARQKTRELFSLFPDLINKKKINKLTL